MESEAATMNYLNAHQHPPKSLHISDDPPTSDARPLGFDCSICLDSASDPVVTLCGHLYCWPCIYKWLQVDASAPHDCPVCKSPLSQNSLVPLYGRGSTKRLDIPKRPTIQRNINGQHYHPRHHNHDYFPSPWGTTGVFSSTAGGVLGGLAIAILPLMSRNIRTNNLMANGNSASQRIREMRVENSLQQIWAFMFCCAILCLLFF
ncbi:uncharacterized protein A4U43_C07F20810 [Asparagus officinalis]|uniref:E3 ubiquitin-protein ligase RMA n=1 Tax=Asparagus officinalis TaxID=4686 RepID=A0A5P1EDX6_ASPOF|nr:E3 ubiquitin-protein ligase RMA3-like [Asparagus officinalis]ONK63973.1 uncharacterized protein A4U43_C07F20810 [Asparagus officinalis]